MAAGATARRAATAATPRPRYRRSRRSSSEFRQVLQISARGLACQQIATLPLEREERSLEQRCTGPPRARQPRLEVGKKRRVLADGGVVVAQLPGAAMRERGSSLLELRSPRKCLLFAESTDAGREKAKYRTHGVGRAVCSRAFKEELGGAEVGQVHVRIATADAQLRAVHSILAVVVAIDTDGTRRDICGWVRHDAVEVEDAALRADSCLF